MTMYVLKVIGLFGGLALFLFGMDVMGKSLEHTAGGKLQTILARMSSTVPRGFLLGMAVTAATLADGSLVRNVILFSVLVYELVGPSLTKRSLTLAGEIKPEGRTSARTPNQPKPPVSIH